MHPLGFSVPETETVFVPYAERTHAKWFEFYQEEGCDKETANKLAIKRVEREIKQGVQELFYKLNSVNNSLG